MMQRDFFVKRNKSKKTSFSVKERNADGTLILSITWSPAQADCLHKILTCILTYLLGCMNPDSRFNHQFCALILKQLKTRASNFHGAIFLPVLLYIA